MTQEPPWAPLPAHLCSVSSVLPWGQVNVPSGSSKHFTPTSSPGSAPCPVRMFHPHQAPNYMARAGIRPAECTAVHPAVYTGMTLPQEAGKPALLRDVGRQTDHRTDVSSRLTRQGQPGSCSFDHFSPSLTVTWLCSHPRCPSFGLTLVSRAGQCGQRSEAEAQ